MRRVFAFRSVALSVCFGLIIASCGSARADAPAGPAPRASDLQAVVVASQLLVGEQRVPIGVLFRKSPVNDATVRLRVYRNSESDPLRSDSDASFKGEGLQGNGLYVARVSFAAPGAWVGEVSMRLPSGLHSVQMLPLTVLSAPIVPAPGQPAPRSRNPTIHDVADVRDIDTGVPPNDMHELSIADAIAQRRPTLIVFATPGFCPSAMCGPQVRAVQAIQPLYRDRVAFIHVEIYTGYRPDPAKRQLSPTVIEWRLQSEPWVFLIGTNGMIRFAFEGPTAADELRQAVERLLAEP